MTQNINVETWKKWLCPTRKMVTNYLHFVSLLLLNDNNSVKWLLQKSPLEKSKIWLSAINQATLVSYLNGVEVLPTELEKVWRELEDSYAKRPGTDALKSWFVALIITVNKAISCLSEKTQEVLYYRYGLGGKNCSTPAATARHLKIDERQVLALEIRALGKLRQPGTQTLIERQLNVREQDMATVMADAEEDEQRRENNPDLEDLGLSARAFNCLYQAGARNLHDLAALTEKETRQVVGLGSECLEEVRKILHEYGLDFARPVNR